MPKKGSKLTRAQKEAEDDSYTRPSLTLSNFLVPEMKKTNTEIEHNIVQPNEPSLIKTAEHSTGASNDRLGPTPQSNTTKSEEISFKIKRTKKGNLPITYESRSKGKKVTVISNVSGDGSALLSLLKRATGTGGVTKGEMIELQGDHRKFLETYLKKHPCLH